MSPITPLIHRDLLPRDIDPKQDPSLSELNRRMVELYDRINSLAGYNGEISLAGNLNLNGKRITGLGKAQASSDALSQTSADPIYSPAVQKAAMESLGSHILQTTRRLNDATQQHRISSDLNTQGSIPPSNITGALAFVPTATTVAWTWTNIFIQFADQSYLAIPNGTFTVTGLVNATQYDFFPYYDTALGVLSFVAGAGFGNGIPQIAVLSSVAASTTAAAQLQNTDGRIALTATASGAQVTTGGASGNATLRTRS